ncbi:HbrB-domain-containing protein [Macrolepiota fuliginosa MF-IS2]|uniref:HbrB-domain-containing protein n=1 Tax=Macrolepiota fuliginosa MF-IS2 TaxID=1400762 RepID=A0A9P5XLC5_9AGAR|nr:HbrB-domain-containing protein [Macrolepiota fuliginosa MF-IS2]
MLPAWTASYTPRRSHEQTPPELQQGRASTSDEQWEPRRRTSSDSTPRQAAASTRFLGNANEQDANRNVLGTDGLTTSKRLGFLADKISSSLSGGSSGANLKGSLPSSQLLHPHSHTKADSTSTSPSISPSNSLMNPSSSTINIPKTHTSPSKGSYGRTYDAKLVSREMHRLAPQLSSSSSMSLVPPGSISQVSLATTSSTDPWGALHVHVLPLFNGEPLRIPIEDLNTLVKRHIQTVVTSTPNRALNMLEADAAELIAAGMVTLNAKLMGVHDNKLIARVVETWNFFWDQVLTYVEGVLLPLQTHALLSSLYRTPKSHRAKSPNRQTNAKPSSKSEHSSTHIDVRTIALRSFRDRVIVPLAPRLFEQLRLETISETHHQPRLQQMLLVLASQSENRSNTFSLAPPDPDASPSAAAIDDLLRALRNPRQPDRPGLFKSNAPFPVRAPSFVSGGLPRDRRGRVAHKHRNKPAVLSLGLSDEDDVFGDETPRLGQSYDAEHRRRVELLDSLKSPDVDSHAGPRASGGWGLGAGQADKMVDEDDEDELDQVQLQEKVCIKSLSRIVGIGG